jgi:glycosyltransferase involved in cell wall biosynthesis
LQDNRKGSVFLKKLNSSGLIEKAQFVYIGAGHLEHFSHSSTLALGFLRDELSLQIAYCAADLLIHPALIDNLPNTVAESMGCGTPALSYAVGGLPDMVVPHKSGWLVRELDVDSMLQTLDSLLSANALSQIRESTRAHAKSLFSTRIVGDQYKSHFISYLTKE